MRIFKAIMISTAFFGMSIPSFAADTKTQEPQVLHCGIKDGEPKQYGTRSAAEADGATHITVKDGEKPCPGIK